MSQLLINSVEFKSWIEAVSNFRPVLVNQVDDSAVFFKIQRAQNSSKCKSSEITVCTVLIGESLRH